MRITTSQIDVNATLVDVDRRHQLDGLIAHPIAVHVGLCAKTAVWELGKGCCRAPLGIVQQRRQVTLQLRRAIALQQGCEALHAEPIRRGLRPKIPRDLARTAKVRANHGEQITVDFPSFHKAHRRNDQTFLINLTGHADATRRPSPDVHVMRNVCHIADQVIAVKNRCNERDIVQMHPAQVGIVH